MSERTDQLSAEASSDDDAAGGRSFDTGIDDSLLGETDAKAEPADDDDAEGSRLGGYFSIRTFLVLLVGLAVFSGIGRSIVPIVSGLGSLLGAFAGAFLVGLISSKRRYAETGLAAALLGAFSAIPGFVTFGLGLQSVAMIAAVGGGIGLVVALLGVYFGRDLRDGLTKDI